jgi:hypothetical protein
MPDETILLGEFELIGKNKQGDLYELVFLRTDTPKSVLDTIRFDRGPRSAVLIKGKALANKVDDGEKFRIILERIE